MEPYPPRDVDDKLLRQSYSEHVFTTDRLIKYFVDTAVDLRPGAYRATTQEPWLGNQRCIELSGPPGSGKSTLLRYTYLQLFTPSKRQVQFFPLYLDFSATVSPPPNHLDAFLGMWLRAQAQNLPDLRGLWDAPDPGFDARFAGLLERICEPCTRARRCVAVLFIDGLEEVEETVREAILNRVLRPFLVVEGDCTRVVLAQRDHPGMQLPDGMSDIKYAFPAWAWVDFGRPDEQLQLLLKTLADLSEDDELRPQKASKLLHTPLDPAAASRVVARARNEHEQALAATTAYWTQNGLVNATLMGQVLLDTTLVVQPSHLKRCYEDIIQRRNSGGPATRLLEQLDQLFELMRADARGQALDPAHWKPAELNDRLRNAGYGQDAQVWLDPLLKIGLVILDSHSLTWGIDPTIITLRKYQARLA